MTFVPDQTEDLHSILAPGLQSDPGGYGKVVAIAGGGGKTAAMFSLALAARGKGLRVAVTTTTHIRDPRREKGRSFDHLLLLDGTARDSLQGVHVPGPGITVIASGTPASGGRLHGVDPGQIASLGTRFDLVLVESDGSRGLPVKAPASHEPVIPPGTNLVIGVVGLDCLGKPMDEATVHRPELFGPLCGCAPGEPIRTSHIAALCLAGDGLFKHCPPQAAKVLLLNKADLLLPRAADGTATNGGSGPSSAAGNRLTGLIQDLVVLDRHLDAWIVCSLEPRFSLFHESAAWRDGRVREGREV